MDARMPELDGIQATKQLTSGSEGPVTRVLILTTFDLDEYVFQALHSGASGFLLKDVAAAWLAQGVRIVAGGEALLSPTITQRLIEAFVAAPPAYPPSGLADLTPREMEIFRLVASGLSNAEIADELVIGDATVKTHVSRLLMKLGARDRIQAVVIAPAHVASRIIMNVPAGPLIVLTGPPGAGKTTVARLVADALDPAVHLPADEYWRFIRTGYVAPWRAESQDQNAIVIDALSSGAVIYAAGGYHVVLDGIIGPWFLNRLLAHARTGQVDVHYVILRPAQTVAAQRILGRPEDELSRRHHSIAAERPDDPGAAARMYQEFSALGPYEKHVIDSSAMSAKETAEVVRQLVAAGHLRVCPP